MSHLGSRMSFLDWHQWLPVLYQNYFKFHIYVCFHGLIITLYCYTFILPRLIKIHILLICRCAIHFEGNTWWILSLWGSSCPSVSSPAIFCSFTAETSNSMKLPNFIGTTPSSAPECTSTFHLPCVSQCSMEVCHGIDPLRPQTGLGWKSCDSFLSF